MENSYTSHEWLTSNQAEKSLKCLSNTKKEIFDISKLTRTIHKISINGETYRVMAGNDWKQYLVIWSKLYNKWFDEIRDVQNLWWKFACICAKDWAESLIWWYKYCIKDCVSKVLWYQLLWDDIVALVRKWRSTLLLKWDHFVKKNVKTNLKSAQYPQIENYDMTDAEIIEYNWQPLFIATENSEDFMVLWDQKVSDKFDIISFFAVYWDVLCVEWLWWEYAKYRFYKLW